MDTRATGEMTFVSANGDGPALLRKVQEFVLGMGQVGVGFGVEVTLRPVRAGGPAGVNDGLHPDGGGAARAAAPGLLAGGVNEEQAGRVYALGGAAAVEENGGVAAGVPAENEGDPPLPQGWWPGSKKRGRGARYGWEDLVVLRQAVLTAMQAMATEVDGKLTGPTQVEWDMARPEELPSSNSVVKRLGPWGDLHEEAGLAARKKNYLRFGKQPKERPVEPEWREEDPADEDEDAAGDPFPGDLDA